MYFIPMGIMLRKNPESVSLLMESKTFFNKQSVLFKVW